MSSRTPPCLRCHGSPGLGTQRLGPGAPAPLPGHRSFTWLRFSSSCCSAPPVSVQVAQVAAGEEGSLQASPVTYAQACSHSRASSLAEAAANSEPGADFAPAEDCSVLEDCSPGWPPASPPWRRRAGDARKGATKVPETCNQNTRRTVHNPEAFAQRAVRRIPD